MATITTAQMKILEAINRYTFLTVPLIDILKIHKNKVSIYRSLQGLKNRSKPFVYTQNYGVHPTKGQLPSLLYLSSYAKELLIESGYEENQIHIPTNRTFVSSDYFHRITNIQMHLYMDLYLQSIEDAELLFLDYYFSKSQTSQKLYARVKNRIDLQNDRYIIPDIITKFVVGGKEYLYLVEIHNGTNSNKAFYQCLQHIKAIDLGSPKKKYNHQKNNRIIFIFEHKSCMDAVMRKMDENKDLQKYRNLFLFNTKESMQRDFAKHWMKYNGEETLFY